MQTKPRQIAIETLAIFRRIKVTIGQPPIGNRPSDAMDQLADTAFSLVLVPRVTIKILADNHICRELGPRFRNLTIFLFK